MEKLHPAVAPSAKLFGVHFGKPSIRVVDFEGTTRLISDPQLVADYNVARWMDEHSDFRKCNCYGPHHMTDHVNRCWDNAEAWREWARNNRSYHAVSQAHT